MRRTRSILALLILSSAPRAWADGTLDPNFGSGGIVTTVFTGPGGTPSGIGFASAVQTDGRIIVAGTANDAVTTTSGNDIVLARYEANGALDATFGALGRVATDLGGTEVAYDVGVQTDGRIVVVGAANAPDQMFIVRYLTNGFLDPAFGTGGIVRPTLPGSPTAFAVAFEPSGNIVVGGPSGAAATLMTVLRLQPNGTPDPTFGTAGVATIDPSSNGTGGSLFDIALQPDGKIVLAGYANAGASNIEVAVARLTTSGAPDAGFGGAGVVRTDVSPSVDLAHDVALQPDGMIVIAGYASGPTIETLVIRYGGTNGAPDLTFGSGGVALTSVGQNNQARALVVQPDGKITTAGFDGADFLLARFSSVGVLDSSFGTAGILRTSIGPSGPDEAHDLEIPFPGALLAVGRSDQGSSSFALARYSASTPVTLEGFSVE
jgi:uncharacterized delta-60 repeat protein